MQTTKTAPVGYRHACTSSLEGDYGHTRGPGKPKREYCAYCHGRIATYTGTWGVFTWTMTDRYPLDQAVRTFAQHSTAERFAGRDEWYVVRWVPAA